MTINTIYYQVICRNGSLAAHTGFDIDSDCALASYVDSTISLSILVSLPFYRLLLTKKFFLSSSGEVVIKSNNTEREGIINALLSYHKYFHTDPDFKMYGKFDGHENVLVNVSDIIIS